MINFFDLSLQDRILLALATLNDYRNVDEIAAWLDHAIDYFGQSESTHFKRRNKRSIGTIKNILTVMSTSKNGNHNGYLLERSKKSRKLFYKIGRNTVGTRLGALFIMLVWKVYDANHNTLTEEHVSQLVENNKKLAHQFTGGDTRVAQEVEWLMDEISKEGAEQLVLNRSRLDYAIKADYFRKDRELGLIVPTKRLVLSETEYVQALIHLMPELKKAQFEGERSQ